MQSGLTLAEVVSKLDAQASAKKDFIAPTKRTQLNASQGGMVLTLEDQGSFPLQPLAHRQLATFTDVPARYYDRMMSEAPGLLAENVNTWLARSAKTRMVRTLDNRARAYLSNQYQRIDHVDICKVALPVLHDLPDVRFVSAEVTDARLYLQFVFPRIQGEVKVGDVVQAGGILTNSEVGLGAYGVSGLAWRLICLNGMKTTDVFRKAHVGRAVEDSEQLWAEDTVAADDRAILLKVRDMVKAIADETRFKAHLEKLQGLTEGQTKSPVKTVEKLSNKLGLAESEKEGLLTSLIQGGDFSRWGITNAVTSLAHTAKDYDRAVEFEGMGGQLVELGRDEWKEVLADAA